MYVRLYLSYRNATAQSDQEKQEGEIGEGVNRGELGREGVKRFFLAFNLTKETFRCTEPAAVHC
jgi:hypothetical protein